MNHALQAYNVMTTTSPHNTPLQSINLVHTIYSIMLPWLNKPNMAHLWTGELVVDLQDLM